MKVAIFSDVQANLPAMQMAATQMLAWRPDLVIMAGDLVNRGPSSLACVEYFDELRRYHGWLPVMGNHESWMLRCANSPPKTGMEEVLQRFAAWTYQQIQPRMSALENWPDHLCFHGDHEQSWVHVTHASMISNRFGITANITEEQIHDALPPDIALFVTAHTHRPMHSILNGVPILNVGSVGSPFDGDVRGSYARLEWRSGCWHSEIVRFDYDRVQAERDFWELGFIDGGGPVARILFEEWRQARPLMSRWRNNYEPAVLAGERDANAAVTAFLAEHG
ncbi:metallophosphoesterase family protein [Chromatium okenii]|jgi:predicted phosphodiesterase|uniref:Metallophosphoesterase n=1 Tax=Chromatium okenii TaxID=61644 RepID=A0A2S7XQ44_9GAMM|nr:metallophosphoesterase [Chromatium okenii]PQJ95558.1 metallophosphoesterase [Chromatium okenii]